MVKIMSLICQVVSEPSVCSVKKPHPEPLKKRKEKNKIKHKHKS